MVYQGGIGSGPKALGLACGTVVAITRYLFLHSQLRRHNLCRFCAFRASVLTLTLTLTLPLSVSFKGAALPAAALAASGSRLPSTSSCKFPSTRKRCTFHDCRKAHRTHNLVHQQWHIARCILRKYERYTFLMPGRGPESESKTKHLLYARIYFEHSLAQVCPMLRVKTPNPGLSDAS